MLQVVFVPGILGCTMVRKDGVVLWPPLSQEAPMDLPTRTAGLLDPTTEPGEIIRRIDDLLFGTPEYGPVLDALEGLAGVTLHKFVYDWRRDAIEQAGLLAGLVQTAAGRGSVVIVAHSMGGLLARLMLEGPGRKPAWFKAVKQLITVAAPHLGAPLALFRVLGMDGIAPIVFPASAVATLASKPELFPAAHQLLPAPSVECVTYPNGGKRDVLSAFIGLAPAGVKANRAVHAVLGKYRKPAGVLYRSAYASGHLETVAGIVVDALGYPKHQPGDGDGTVPLWSADPDCPPEFFDDSAGFRADHVGVLNNSDFREALMGWVGEFREMS